ncbi:MAG: hypothetical protein IKK66_02270 [Ruminococcus sp.]|nr:hypothetical protein [Ruminococcus sp.]
MKKILFAILCMTALTGCSTGIDVNEMAYVRAAAIDGNNCSFSFYLDEQVVSVSADSMETAESAAELTLGKEIFTGHTELVILNECDKREILEYMLREWKVPPSCRVANAENAGEILKNRKAEEIVGVIETAEEKGLTEKCDIVTVLGKILNGKNSDLPMLTVEGAIE